MITNIDDDGLNKKDSEESTSSSSVDGSYNENIVKAAEFITSINLINSELSKIPLNPAEKNYIDTCVFPLVQTLERLSATSVHLATSANLLAVSINTPGKSSKLKDTEKLIYNINEQCADLYKVIRKRINVLLNCY